MNELQPVKFKALEDLGRVQLSKRFFMREFLYSEISQIEGIPNIPDDLDLAIEAGKNLCEKVLEPIQDALGRISIRSAFRSCAINQRGNDKGHNCAANEKNYAGHIWDKRSHDKKTGEEYIGATACVIVTAFLPYYQETGDWTALAWWIHDHIEDYAHMTFFQNYAAFNINWNNNSNNVKFIDSYVDNPHTGKKGYLTKKGMDNFEGSHEENYKVFIRQLKG